MESGEEDLDTHMCLSCETTIIGLDNYVRHKKFECPRRKSAAKKPNPTPSNDHSTPMTVDVQGVNPLHQPSHMSPSTSNIVNPNVVLGSSNDDVDKFHDFISSLALQSRVPPPEKTTEKRPTDLDLLDMSGLGNDKSLPLTNLLNLNLGFSSDSDPDLSEYLQESDDDYYPPENHTGGKWKPGSRPPRGHTGGKWKPGMGPRPIGGKRARNISGDDADEEEEDEDNQSVKPDERVDTASPAPPAEKPPQEEVVEEKSSPSKPKEASASENELGNGEHETETKVQETSEETDEEHYCPICKDQFYNKYNMARHLLTQFHYNRAKGHPEAIPLFEKYHLLMLRLSPFQCSTCKFYCKSNDDLKLHVKTVLHVSNTEDLLGPQLCTICKFMAPKNEDIVQHLASEEHIDKAHELTKKRPCVIRENRKKVDCKVCGLTAHSVTKLKKHILAKHHNSDEVSTKKRVNRVCPHCEKAFSSQISLNIHMRRRHTKEKPFTCEPCSKSYADKYTLQVHMQTKSHQTKLLQMSELDDNPAPSKKCKTKPRKSEKKGLNLFVHRCEFCEFRSKRFAELHPHFVKRHPDKAKVCKPCATTTYRTVDFKTHLESKRHKMAMKLLEGGTDHIFKCETCGRVFAKERLLLLHTITHQSGEHPTGGNSKLKEKYKEFFSNLKKTKEKTTVTCPECGKKVSRGYLMSHLRTHNDCPQKCASCHRSLPSIAALQHHIDKNHSNLEPHVCEECGKRFVKASSYRHHMAVVHRNAPKNFICDECGHAFVQKWQLTHHSKIHGQKHLKCTYEGCSLLFRSQSDMVIHLRTHTNERPFLCDMCGYRGKSQNQLTRHRRTHTGERNFSCQYCPYRALNSTHLHRHMRVHIGSKPYKCPYCDYVCNTHENIRKHIIKTKKHVGLKVYVCKFCQYGTNESKCFRDHLLADHKEEVKDESLDIVSVYSGLYQKESDPKAPLEGGQVLPVKERKRRQPKQKKRLEQLDEVPWTSVATEITVSLEGSMEKYEKKGLITNLQDLYRGGLKKESSASSAARVEVTWSPGAQTFASSSTTLQDPSTSNSLPSASTLLNSTYEEQNIQVTPVHVMPLYVMGENKNSVLSPLDLVNPDEAHLISIEMLSTYPKHTVMTFLETVREAHAAVAKPETENINCTENRKDLSVFLVEMARTPGSLVPLHLLAKMPQDFVSVLLEIPKGTVKSETIDNLVSAPESFDTQQLDAATSYFVSTSSSATPIESKVRTLAGDSTTSEEVPKSGLKLTDCDMQNKNLAIPEDIKKTTTSDMVHTANAILASDGSSEESPQSDAKVHTVRQYPATTLAQSESVAVELLSQLAQGGVGLTAVDNRCQYTSSSP